MDEKYTEEGLIIVSEGVADIVRKEIEKRALSHEEDMAMYLDEIECRMENENPELHTTLYSTLTTINEYYDINEDEDFNEIVRAGFLLNYEMLRTQANTNSLEDTFKKDYSGKKAD